MTMQEMGLLYIFILLWTVVYISGRKEQTVNMSDEHTRSVNKETVSRQQFTKAYEIKTSISIELSTRTGTTLSTDNDVNTQMLTIDSFNISAVMRRPVIYEIGKTLCPYSDFCGRKKDFQDDFRHAPCCADCSCDDNCWETGTCCPDKEFDAELEPVRRCHVSIVKALKPTTVYNGVNDGIWAYYILDSCPESETNMSVINKCTLSDIDNINDYRWVSDNVTGSIYQNKFCADCHGKNGLTAWQLETRCKNLLFSNFSSLDSLLLSGECDIINKEPETEINSVYQKCAIPFYTRCNQTGLWQRYDRDVNRACDIYNAFFIEAVNGNVTVYKNAFCYACNSHDFKNAPKDCLHVRDSNQLTFSTLLDYKRYEDLKGVQPSNSMQCKVDEIMDKYMQKCRPLVCPFAHAPYYEHCEQLVEKTKGLSVEVIYSLSALWSKVNYNPLGSSGASEKSITTEIFYKLRKRYAFGNSGVSCPVCYQSLNFLKEIAHSQIVHNNSASQLEVTASLNDSKEVNLLYHVISFTEKACQLTQLLANFERLAGSTVKIKVYDEVIMILQVKLVTENIQSLISGSTAVIHDQMYEDCNVAFKMTREKDCPRIRISFSEFQPYLTENNYGIIHNLFSAPQSGPEEYEEICVQDYFVKLNRSTFQMTSSEIRTESFVLVFMGTVGIAQQLL